MKKREIVEKNKIGTEQLLQEKEIICNETLDLFYPFTKMANDYLNEIYLLLFNNNFEFKYEPMEIDDTIALVREFLLTIDERYVKIFDKSLIDGTFELFLPEDNLIKRPEGPTTMDKPEAIIYIPIHHNVTDGSIIIHEFFHYLNDKEQLIGIRDLFTEMISIYFELRFSQFLDDKGITTNKFNKETCERIYSTAYSADNLFYTGSIFDVYHNMGKINRKNIKIINKYRKIYSEDAMLNFYSSESFLMDMFDFYGDASYLLGTMISFYILNNPTVSDIKMKYINDNVNQMSIKDVLKILQTNFDEYPNWIKACKENLKKAMSEIYEKNYSYSRTNSSR